MRLFYFFENLNHFLLKRLSHGPQPICIAFIVIPLFLNLHDIEALGREERVLKLGRFSVDSEIKFIVGRGFFSPPLLILYPWHFYFAGLRPLGRLGDVFIVFEARFFIFPILFLFDLFINFLLKSEILLHFLSFGLLFTTFGLLHLNAKLLLILVLLAGLALGLLRIDDEESAPEGLIVSHGDF